MGRNVDRWWVLLVMLLLFGCGGGSEDGGTGSIAVRAIWPGEGQPAARIAAAAPAGVTTVRVTVTGEGISPPISSDFPAAAGQGTVGGVPAGSNRTVTLEGIVGADVVYRGSVTGIAVTAGQMSDAGVVSMEFIPGSPGVVVTPATVSLIEGDSGSFTVVLGSQPSGTVTIDVSSADGGTVLVATGGGMPAVSTSLVFGAGTWDTVQTVSVSSQGNFVVDGPRAVTVAVDVNPSGTDDPGYGALAPGAVGDVTVNVADDDQVGVSVLPTTLLVAENSGSAAFEVTLESQPDGDVALRATSGSSTDLLVATSGAPAGSVDLVFTAGTWNVAQTVSATGVDNLIVDGDRAVTVAVTVVAAATADTTGYAALSAAQIPNVAATVQDDDAAAGGSTWGQMRWDVGKWQ